ncbi:HlyD family secretion protein [Pararhodobacter sp.]|uniref:HlyD family secretion protein n=1 Tax=Pararhodobacter sp. TaxID=2127056 RepID=UPI002AFE574D|nr:HlyD family secretion protein [Pararhodobacter sp.]
MKTLKLVGLGIVALAGAVGLYAWWQHGVTYPSTDDAYLQANLLTISPQVGGQVATVNATENAYVTEGDVLFTLDPAPLQAAFDIAQAQFDLATQTAGAGGSNVAAAEAQVAQAMAALAVEQTDFHRTEQLFRLSDVSQAALDQATATRDQAQAAVDAANAALSAARDQLGATGAQNAGVRAALGQLALARLNLEHTTVSAPASGWVSNISLRPGQIVAAGQPLFSLVEDGAWWVDGNFKETDIDRIRPGQPVSLTIDMYPGTTLTGTVASIGAGSGSVFSLLPAQNASGNWVKVTQRFPVRIALDAPPADRSRQLRVGASMVATVDTSGLDAGQ